eukprot:2286916-Rhodomonas_salina.1
MITRLLSTRTTRIPAGSRERQPPPARDPAAVLRVNLICGPPQSAAGFGPGQCQCLRLRPGSQRAPKFQDWTRRSSTQAQSLKHVTHSA